MFVLAFQFILYNVRTKNTVWVVQIFQILAQFENCIKVWPGIKKRQDLSILRPVDKHAETFEAPHSKSI